MYSNCCCSCSFEAEIIKIGQLSHKIYSNNIVTFQESTPILNACTKISDNLLKAPRDYDSLSSFSYFTGFSPLLKNPGIFHVLVVCCF